jgi:hypothetical protein
LAEPTSLWSSNWPIGAAWSDAVRTQKDRIRDLAIEASILEFFM